MILSVIISIQNHHNKFLNISDFNFFIDLIKNFLLVNIIWILKIKKY